MTRLTYDSAHLRSTKESLTIEYFETKLIFWVENFFWLKIFLGENFLAENILEENILDENFWVEIFGVTIFG